MQLDRFNAESFLSAHWQKKPLLIRQPWARWSNPLSPEELAGLACEEEIESRLIERRAGSWHVEHGPIPEDRFSGLGDAPWTLLVQSVDQFAPPVAALVEPFRFIPDWRIDDVMVSYASDGGGVGPHFDQYDVFLVQGLGRRRWRIGPHCDEDTPLVPNDDLRLLEGFEMVEEWILEPGDILYVPPGIAHEGIAVGDDCMTYSVGFRAPSRGELLAGWSEHVFDRMREDDRYTDPDLKTGRNPGEIAPEAIARLHAMAIEGLLDRGAFARWFGTHASARKYPDLDWAPEDSLDAGRVRQGLADGEPLARNPASRFSFIRDDGGRLLLFVDGQCFECDGEASLLAESICGRAPIALDPAIARSDAAIALATRLLNQGSLTIGD